MKYITEEDLRDLFRKEPFTDYDLEPGTRLTPGARQFLVDRGINMMDIDSVKLVTPLEEKKITYKSKNKNKKLYSSMHSIEALFLLTEEELLSKDVCLAQSVIKLGKQFTYIVNMVKNKGTIENLCCTECTGINKNNFSEELDDCFEISEFHIQLENGREIVILNRLRCALNEIITVMQEDFEDSDDEAGLCEDIIGKVNQIINSLSQLICSAFGGKKCQRQN